MVEPVRVVKIPQRYTLTVTLPGPRPRAMVVEGRCGKLIAWICWHRKHIEAMGVGALVFNMSLNRFRPELRDVFPEEEAIPETLADLLETESLLGPP